MFLRIKIGVSLKAAKIQSVFSMWSNVHKREHKLSEHGSNSTDNLSFLFCSYKKYENTLVSLVTFNITKNNLDLYWLDKLLANFR